MVPVSIVIITKNEAALIANCIEMALLITDDIVVVDSGSTDETLNIIRQYSCRRYHKNWAGYGANKNKGIELARHNWILSIDADEVPNMELVLALYDLDLRDPNVVYDIKFRSFIGKKLIRHGSWGRDHHLRLFNRTVVKWSESEVHETLILPAAIHIKKLAGNINHYSVQNINECNIKALHYARLSAKQYMISGKKSTFFKLYFSPVFGFVKNYLFRLGFLDGAEGFNIALMIYKYTRLKYAYLKLHKQGKYIADNSPPVNNSLVVEY
jgi:glycosyltransferase involved in cell wall biosynthesis